MQTHEMTCTMNPKRGCYMCDAQPSLYDFLAIGKEMLKRDDVEIMGEDKDAGFITKSEDAIKWLQVKLEGCPACTLSVLRQSDIYAFDVFDYKAEVIVWNSEKDREFRDMVGGGL